MYRADRLIDGRLVNVILCLTCDYFRADKSGPKNYKRKRK